MAKGILGRKLGMTQIFDAAGNLIPVTVVECTANVVLQQKTVETDGYVATQLGFEDKREKLANLPEKGHVAKAQTAPKRFIKEFRFEAQGNDLTSLSVGSEVKCDIFSEGDVIDVTGTSKGKGFAGTIKRYHGHRTPMTHGGGPVHRHAGSMGACSSPSRIYKGKKMPGHMGAVKVTVQNLDIVKIDTENNLLVVKGAIPGPKGSVVTVKSTVKNG